MNKSQYIYATQLITLKNQYTINEIKSHALISITTYIKVITKNVYL